MQTEKTNKELKQQGNTVFALDIGTRTVVGVVGEQVEDESGVGVFNMIDYYVEPHPKRAMIDGQIEDIRQVAKIVTRVKERLQERTGIKLERVSIAAAGRALKTKRIAADFDVSDYNDSTGISGDKIRSMEIETIQMAAQELAEERGVTTPYYCVGYSINEYILDEYKMINLESHRGTNATVDLIATFLPNVVVEGLYSVVDICGLSVASLTLEPIAAMNAIIPKEIRLINIALVDIGAGTSDIAISKEGSIVAYAMATTAGDEITEELIKSYFVDFNTAEAIKQTCAGGEEYTYRDIFGLERRITPEEFAAKVKPGVELLAQTICENITTANGGASPAAVFLIGGGSLIGGLVELVSEKLALPKERVALGSNENLKGIDTGSHVMGAEFVTPLGIAVTGVMNKGYDFSVITLNDRAIRIFNTNKITVFELLSMAGYKSREILGRSGHNLIYSLNGERKTLRGGGFEPAQILKAGKPVSLQERITGGDRVQFIPAVCGENARLLLKDTVPLFEGLQVLVNGEKKDPEYAIANLDDIVTIAPSATSATSATSAPEPSQVKETIVESDITITLNGSKVEMIQNEDKMVHTFFELFNYADMDIENPPNPSASYIMTLNGNRASFNDILNEGDDAVLQWQA
jgi:cell division protein FtsA